MCIHVLSHSTILFENIRAQLAILDHNSLAARPGQSGLSKLVEVSARDEQSWITGYSQLD